MLALVAIALVAQSPLTAGGAFETRTTAAVTRADGAPGLAELLEANVQLKLVPARWLTMQVDASLVWQLAAFVHGGERDLPAYRPQAIVAEAYADFTAHEHLRVVVGKKRVLWGPGLAFNPTDVLNPPKDPTDPTAQRGGAWLVMVEAPFKKVTLSAAFAARATRQYAGLPTALLVDPPTPTAESVRGWVPDQRTSQPHFAAAARLYWLVDDTDVTLSYSLTNLYADARTYDSRLGLSLARTFGPLELHAELAGFLGSTALQVDSSCLSQPMACAEQGRSLLNRPWIDASFVNARALLGGRYQLSDDAMFTFEYFFNGDGHDAATFRTLVGLASQQPQLLQAAMGLSNDPGTPQRFTFEALRRHYVVMAYSKPQLVQDVNISLSTLIALEDLSMQIVPQVQWQPYEWLLLTLAAYLPLPGLPAWGATVGSGTYGELALSPFGSRFVFSARAFY